MNEIMDRADEDEGVLAGPDVQVNSLNEIISCNLRNPDIPKNPNPDPRYFEIFRI